MKRATCYLQEKGIALTVKRGLWGYYLNDPALRRQQATCYKSVNAVIEAALKGERPRNTETEVEGEANDK